MKNVVILSIHRHNALKVGRNCSSARETSSFARSFYITTSPSQIFPKSRVEDTCLEPGAPGEQDTPAAWPVQAVLAGVRSLGHTCCSGWLTTPAHCLVSSAALRKGFHLLHKGFALYPALLLPQLSGHSDANSSGDTARKHQLKKRLRLYEPKKISRKTSQEQH